MWEIHTVVSDGRSVARTANISILVRMLENQENRSRVRSLSLRRLPQNSLCAHYRKVSHRNRAWNHVIWRTGTHGIRLRGPSPVAFIGGLHDDRKSVV